MKAKPKKKLPVKKRLVRKAWLHVKHDMEHPEILWQLPYGVVPSQNYMPVMVRQSGKIFGLSMGGRRVKPVSDAMLEVRHLASSKNRRR